MKSIFLLRHAKSSWKDDSVDDFDRPLTKRGRRAAAAIGTYLADAGLVPAQILCSSSQRTRETLACLQEHFALAVPVRFEKQLYLADAPLLLRRIKRLNDALASVMLIGHNPGIETLAFMLLGGGEDAPKPAFEKFATGALAVIATGVEHWGEFKPGIGRLESFVRGKDLVRA